MLGKVLSMVLGGGGSNNKLIQYADGTLTEVTAEDLKGVSNISPYAFTLCNKLTNVTIPDSVIDISDYAFPYCVNLKNITIPGDVINIGNYAFYCCESLIGITIPDSVVSIGKYAFGYCSSLTSINYTGTKEQWNKIKLEELWDMNSAIKTIHCIDGDIKL